MRGKSCKTMALRHEAAEILEAIQPASVRAVCYKLFTQGLIPNMGKNATNRVGRVLKEAREEGYIPWDWIVDETRKAELPGAPGQTPRSSRTGCKERGALTAGSRNTHKWKSGRKKARSAGPWPPSSRTTA